MKRQSARSSRQAHAIWRGGEAWLLATLMLLFGAAIGASDPAAFSEPSSEQVQSSGEAVAIAGARGKPSGVHWSSHRIKAGGGKVLLAVQEEQDCSALPALGVPGRVCELDLSVVGRAFQARAPPHLAA